MEHITVKQLADGYVKLIPDTGYILQHTSTARTYREAVIKAEDSKLFKAVEL